MRSDEITVTVHPTLIHCSYRMPNGELFKRKYIGWNKHGAVGQFRLDYARETAEMKLMKTLVDEQNALIDRVRKTVLKRLQDIAADEAALRLWRDEFWPGTRLSTVRERLQSAFADLEVRRSTPYIRIYGRPLINTAIENLPLLQLTGSMDETLKWLTFLKTQREKRLIQDAISLRKGQMNRERDWRRLPLSVRKAALAALEVAHGAG